MGGGDGKISFREVDLSVLSSWIRSSGLYISSVTEFMTYAFLLLPDS